MIRLVFSEPAESDLDDIAAFIAADNPAVAIRVLSAIHAAARRLAEFPGIGRPGRLPGTREFPVTSLPYLIVYEVLGQTLTVFAVLHGARDAPHALAARRDDLNRP